METETNKGKQCFMFKDNKYTQYYQKKNNNFCWRCTIRLCNARVETDENGAVVKEFGFHTHGDTTANQLGLVEGSELWICAFATFSNCVFVVGFALL